MHSNFQRASALFSKKCSQMRRTKPVASCHPSLLDVLGRGRRQRNATFLSQPLWRKPLHRHSDDLIRARRRPQKPRPLPMIPPFVILCCVLPYPFVHSEKNLTQRVEEGACGNDTPHIKQHTPFRVRLYTVVRRECKPRYVFSTRKMKKPPLSRRPVIKNCIT